MMGKVGFVCVCSEPLIVTLKLSSHFLCYIRFNVQNCTFCSHNVFVCLL